MSNKHLDPIPRVGEKGIDQKCTGLANEGNASTLSQLHANEMVHHLHLDEYGNLSNLPDLEPNSHSDQIRSQFWSEICSILFEAVATSDEQGAQQVTCQSTVHTVMRIGMRHCITPLSAPSAKFGCSRPSHTSLQCSVNLLQEQTDLLASPGLLTCASLVCTL